MESKTYLTGVEEPYKTIPVDFDGQNLDYLIPSEDVYEKLHLKRINLFLPKINALEELIVRKSGK